MIFEHKMPQMIYRAVTHSGHQISMNLFQIYGFDAVPEGSEHIIENILGSFFIVYNMQGILIQPSIIPGVYFFKFPLICKRL